MRIIGGKDYYDHAVYYNTDTSRIFKRGRALDNNLVEDKILDKFLVEHINDTINGFHFMSITVIMCGKIYNGLQVDYGDDLNTISEFIWSKDKFYKFIEKNNIVIPNGNNWRHYYNLTKNTIELMNWVRTSNKDNLDYLIKNEIIIAIRSTNNYFGDKNWLINTEGLDKINFAAVLKPHEAYQEIDMFLGTILVNDADNMVQVSNETKIKKYGFDDFSFKNKIHPSKPRSKRAV